MPVTLIVQNEEVDTAGDVTFSYTATVELESPPMQYVVTVPGGPDWNTRLSEAILAEADKAKAVAAIAV